MSEGICQGLVRLLILDADDVTADTFVTPGLSVGLTSPDQQASDLDFDFNLNTLESGAAPDEWMMMNSQGTFW